MATNAATSSFPSPSFTSSSTTFPSPFLWHSNKKWGKERERGGLYGQLFQNQKSHTERNTQIIQE